MARREPDGSTLRQHLEAVERATGKRVADLHHDPLPACLIPLWEVFVALSLRRPQGLSSAPHLTFHDVLTWCSAYRVELTPWEIDTILAADVAALAAMNPKAP